MGRRNPFEDVVAWDEGRGGFLINGRRILGAADVSRWAVTRRWLGQAWPSLALVALLVAGVAFVSGLVKAVGL